MTKTNISTPANFEVGTIRQVHQRLVSEGIMVSEHALRIWVKTGVLPVVYSGNKALISYSNVLNLVNASSTAAS